MSEQSRWKGNVYDGTDSYLVHGRAKDEAHFTERAIAYAEKKYGTSWWRVESIERLPD